MCKYHFTGIEGHRIANLAKQTAYRPAGQDGDEEDEKERNAQLDDYVLHKLFKKSGMFTDVQGRSQNLGQIYLFCKVQGKL